MRLLSMESSKLRGGEAWARLASGIEAGIVGGLAMLGLLVSESLWDRTRLVGTPRSPRIDILWPRHFARVSAWSRFQG